MFYGVSPTGKKGYRICKSRPASRQAISTSIYTAMYNNLQVYVTIQLDGQASSDVFSVSWLREGLLLRAAQSISLSPSS